MARKRTYTIAGIAITAMITYGTFNLISSLEQLHEAERTSAELKSEIQDMQEKNNNITYLISYSDSDSEKEKLARDRLGLVKPGEIIFINQRRENCG